MLCDLFPANRQRRPSDTNSASAPQDPLYIEPSADNRVLVVDDMKPNLLYCVWLLGICNPRGDRVTATSGEAAVELLRSKGPFYFSLVLLDLELGIGVSGIEAAKQIRVFDKTTPIVALTAHDESKVHSECKSAGMNDVLVKPLQKPALETVLLKYNKFNREAGDSTSLQQGNEMSSGSPTNTTTATGIDSDDHLKLIDLSVLGDVAPPRTMIMALWNMWNSSVAVKLQELTVALEQMDSTKVARLLHNLKGSSAQVGAVGIAEECARLEKRASLPTLDDVRRLERAQVLVFAKMKGENSE